MALVECGSYVDGGDGRRCSVALGRKGWLQADRVSLTLICREAGRTGRQQSAGLCGPIRHGIELVWHGIRVRVGTRRTYPDFFSVEGCFASGTCLVVRGRRGGREERPLRHHAGIYAFALMHSFTFPLSSEHRVGIVFATMIPPRPPGRHGPSLNRANECPRGLRSTTKSS